MRLESACRAAHAAGLKAHAGHGLNLKNLPPVVLLPHLEELNIGHAIIGRAIFVGLSGTVAEYKRLIEEVLKRG
jgi:pyridoxine 5-phosphate synthase